MSSGKRSWAEPAHSIRTTHSARSGSSAGTPDRIGLNNRILKIDLTSGNTHEYVYRIEASNRGQGVSEILAVNDHQFLVVERDNRSWLSAEAASADPRMDLQDRHQRRDRGV